HGQCGEHDGQVCLDGIALAVEHRPGRQVGLGHPERLLDVPEVVVGADDLTSAHHASGDVAHVAFESDQAPCPGQGLLIQAQLPAAVADEPGFAGRLVAVDD